MKTLFILIVAFTLTAHAGWFSNDDQQIEQLQTQLAEQKETANHWQLTAFGLGIAVVVALVCGAAIGSKARKETHE